MLEISKENIEIKKEKNLINSYQGITLVALVVTIVVLLILAGITISMLFSDNGIIKQAQNAANKTNEANKKEEGDLKNIEDVLNHYSNGGNTPSKLPSDGSYSETKKVNTPKLGEGMMPITWNGTEWVEPKTEDEWYDYTSGSKKWANAKTADGSMWVWIPRYSYQIETNWHTNSATGGKINIKFLKGITDEASDGTSSWTNSSGQGNWNVHPAFSYGSNVSGIWVAKFEASRADSTSSSVGSSNTIKVQPGVQSWRKNTINDIYTNCLNYNSTLNSHQMKNSEWGAVAYLAQSVYGKNSEVWINPNQNYITGQAGTSVSEGATTSTYTYDNTTYGMQASTTGNIYGIYDMSGGAWEYVAAYVNNGHVNLTEYGNSLVTSTNMKTKDVYNNTTGENIQSADYETAKEKYGDAVYETSLNYNNASGSWYNDSAYFPDLSHPFFYRGGYFDNKSGAGLFTFGYVTGSTGGSYGFRPVIIIL